MVLLDVGLHFAVQAVAVDGYAPPSVWIWAEGDRTTVDDVRLGGHIIVAAVSAGASREGVDIVFFLQGHVVPSSFHRVLERRVLEIVSDFVAFIDRLLEFLYRCVLVGFLGLFRDWQG